MSLVLGSLFFALGVRVKTWGEIKRVCEVGGTQVVLESFNAGAYPGEIDFSGRMCMIQGNGETLDADGRGRFFYGSGLGSSLEIRGLILKNGQAELYGGAIYAGSSATVDIYESTFIHNEATGLYSDGGAIYAAPEGVHVKIWACIFECNTALFGGAINAQRGASVDVYTSTFNSNTALNGGGGAICAVSAIIQIYKSTFEGNTASHELSGYGGAISVRSSGYANSKTEIHTSTFVDNAAYLGGAIAANSGNNVEIFKSDFKRNKATANDTDERGPDIYGAASSSVVFKGCVLSEAVEVLMENCCVLPADIPSESCPTKAPTNLPTKAPTHSPTTALTEAPLTEVVGKRSTILPEAEAAAYVLPIQPDLEIDLKIDQSSASFGHTPVEKTLNREDSLAVPMENLGSATENVAGIVITACTGLAVLTLVACLLRRCSCSSIKQGASPMETVPEHLPQMATSVASVHQTGRAPNRHFHFPPLGSSLI
jgi:predicted outer membrane repeat protein